MATHRILLVRESRISAIHGFLLNHPKLDKRGGGDQTFGVKLALLGDPDDGSVVRARLAGWRLPNDWWITLRDDVVPAAWKVNTTDNDNDLSHYASSNWTLDQVLADVSRKPFALKIVPVEEPPV